MIVALDSNGYFIDRLEKNLREEGLSGRVRAAAGNMFAPDHVLYIIHPFMKNLLGIQNTLLKKES